MKRWSCPISLGNNRTTRYAVPALRPLGTFPRAAVVWVALCLCWSARIGLAAEPVAERTLRSMTIEPAHPVPIVGERLGFHGYWLGIPVGHGSIAVKEIVEMAGRRAYHIEAEGHSNDVLSAFYPIHDSVHSYLDTETLQPLRFEKHQREGHYRADEVVTFDPARRVASYQSLLNGSVKEIPLPSHVQDLVSTLYWFRSQPLQPNTTVTLDLYTDEKIYHTDIQIRQPRVLEILKRGSFPCVMIEPRASFKGLLVKRGRIWAYLTTDRQRLPLMARATTPWGPMSAVIDEDSLAEALKRSGTTTTSRKPQIDGN